MPADIQFSPEEANLFVVLTGMRPPLIATATLYEAGDLANHTADRIDSELSPLVEQVVNHVLTGMNSAVSPEFADNLARYTSKAPGYFPETSSQLRQMGDFAVSTAAQVEYMKVEAIATLASLIATLVIEAALSFFFPEIGLEMMAAEFAAVRLILNTLIGRVLAHILSATLIGIAIQVLLDSIAQAVLIGEGIQQSWNWAETGLQVAVGALGGAMGLALHPLEAWASHELADVLKGFLGHDALDLADNLAADAAKDLGGAAGGVPAKDLGGAAGGPAKDLTGDAAKHVPDGGPAKELEPRPDGGPAVTGPAADGPGWKAPPAVWSREWVIEKMAEIPVGMVIGGIHNAGHETLFNLFLTGQATWSWATFAGGSAQAVARPIGILIGAGGRMAFGLPMPAEKLLAGALGSVTPSMLNEIANAPALPPDGGNLGGQPGSVLPGTGGVATGPESAAGPENDAAGPAAVTEPAAAVTEPAAVVTEPAAVVTEPAAVVAEPAAVQLLRAVGITPGPGTAYAIAVRTGFVPTTGPAEFHPLYARPVMVTLPPMTTSAGMAAAVRPVAALPAAPVPLAQEPPPAYSLVDPLRPASPVQTPVQADDVPLPADEVPLPASGGGQTSALTETPQPVTPQAEGPQAEGPQAETPQAETHDSQMVVPPSDPVRSHGVLDSKGRLVVSPSDPVHHSLVSQGAHAGRLQHSGLASSGPDVVGVSRVRLGGARTDWVRGGDGWHVAAHPGSLELRSRADGQPATVPVPDGSRAVFDASGQLQHVVLPDGVSYERDLSGAWSAGRERPGEVIVVKTDDPVTLASADGTAAVELPPESEEVLDQGTPVAYRQISAGDGTRLAEPRVFLPDGKGGWAQTSSPVDTATYEAWLASANQAHDAARNFYDIAARSSTVVPEAERLTSLDDAGLRRLLGGSRDDAVSALHEWLRRRAGVGLRWTQLSASHKLADGQIVNMAAGEGKSWLFLVDAVRQALRVEVGAVHVITTRGNLADREFEHYLDLLTPLGFDVHRMNPNGPPPAPVEGRPTIYLGTSQDVGFTFLKTGMVPGQVGTIRIDAGVDEIDEALVYSNGQYILSEGVQGEATAEVVAQVLQSRQFLEMMTPADFGRTEGQVGGPAALTEAGLAKAAELLGAPLTEAQVVRLNMAATAEYEYIEDVHYVVYDHGDGNAKVYIIDQVTHEVQYNPETATESRWNGGLAQAVEAKHGLIIRDDPATSKSVTTRELYAQPAYGRVTGASGTALGKSDRFAAQGLSPKIADIPRYYASRLVTEADHVSPNQGAKLDAIAADVRDMKASSENHPQLILVHRNDLVAKLSAKLTAMGVEHTAIDAKWFLKQGTNREAAFKEVIEQGGKPGHVTIINMTGARGLDLKRSPEAKARRMFLQVRVTAHSGLSKDIDIQAENRTARSGDPGNVAYYISPDDDAFALSANPHIKLAVIQYTGALTAHTQAVSSGHQDAAGQTTQALARAETVLRNLVPLTQADAARRMGMYTPTHLPNAPPAAAAAAPAGTTPPSPAQPPPVQSASGTGTVAVPFGGKATQSGFYLPAGPSEAADVHAHEHMAAQFFPDIDGATVLHVHFADGGFLAGGGTLTPEQFKEQLLDGLNLEPGQPLILVACQAAALPAAMGQGVAASALASLSDRPVIAATGDAYTTPSAQVVTTHSGFDADGHPVVDAGPPAHWVIAWPDGTLSPGLGPDLLAILDGKTLARDLPGVAIREGEPAGPPRWPVKWNRGTGNETARVEPNRQLEDMDARLEEILSRGGRYLAGRAGPMADGGLDPGSLPVAVSIDNLRLSAIGEGMAAEQAAAWAAAYHAASETGNETAQGELDRQLYDAAMDARYIDSLRLYAIGWGMGGEQAAVWAAAYHGARELGDETAQGELNRQLYDAAMDARSIDLRLLAIGQGMGGEQAAVWAAAYHAARELGDETALGELDRQFSAAASSQPAKGTAEATAAPDSNAGPVDKPTDDRRRGRTTVEDVPEEPSSLPTLPADSPILLTDEPDRQQASSTPDDLLASLRDRTLAAHHLNITVTQDAPPAPPDRTVMRAQASPPPSQNLPTLAGADLRELEERVRDYRGGIGLAELTEPRRAEMLWRLLDGPGSALRAALALISAESDPVLGRLFADRTLFTTLTSRIPDGNALRPDLRRLVAARFRGGWAALDRGEVEPFGQPDGTFSLGQISSALASINVDAELSGDDLGAIAAALAGLSSDELAKLGGALVSLPLPQRALGTSVLTGIRAALIARAGRATGQGRSAVQRLDRLITPLRRATRGRLAGLGSSGEILLFPPAAASSQTDREPESRAPESRAPESRAPVPVKLRLTRPSGAPVTRADPQPPAPGLVAEMHYRAMYGESPQVLNRDDILAAHAALLADVRQILGRPAGAPPPQAALDRLADHERVGLVLAAAQRRLEQLYGDYLHSVEEHTPVTGMDEEQAEAARVSALTRNDGAARRAAYVGVLSELPAIMASVRSGQPTASSGRIGAALDSIRQQAERAAEQAPAAAKDQAFEDAIQAGLTGLAGYIDEVALTVAAGDVLASAADRLPLEFRPAGERGSRAIDGQQGGVHQGDERQGAQPEVMESGWEQGRDGRFYMVRRPVEPGRPQGHKAGQTDAPEKADSSSPWVRGSDGIFRLTGGQSDFQPDPRGPSSRPGNLGGGAGLMRRAEGGVTTVEEPDEAEREEEPQLVLRLTGRSEEINVTTEEMTASAETEPAPGRPRQADDTRPVSREVTQEATPEVTPEVTPSAVSAPRPAETKQAETEQPAVSQAKLEAAETTGGTPSTDAAREAANAARPSAVGRGKRRAIGPDLEQLKQAARRKRLANQERVASLRGEARRLEQVVAETPPSSESSAQAPARAERIADAQARLPGLRAEIARLSQDASLRPSAQHIQDEAQERARLAAEAAASREREWQQALAAARETNPADYPASRPQISFATAEAEVERAAAAAAEEARRSYADPLDAEGVAAYAAYHTEQARVQTWNRILDEAGVGRPEAGTQEAAARPEQGISAERSAILTRLRETERVLNGVMHQMRPGSDARDLRSWRDGMLLVQSRLRRVQADISVFADALPDDIAELEREQRRLEEIPGWLELPFAGPAVGSFRADRIQLAQSRLAEIQAKIAALREQWAREHAATTQRLTTQQRRLEDILARDEAFQAAQEVTGDGSRSEVLADRISLVRTWLRQLRGQLARLAAWKPGTPVPQSPPAGNRPRRQDRSQAGEDTSGPPASSRAPQARPRTVRQRIKAIRSVRQRDWQQWVTATRQSHPAARPAGRT